MINRKTCLMALLPSLAAMMFSCLRPERNPAAQVGRAETGQARILIRIGKVGALAKAAGVSEINLAHLLVTLTAPGEPSVSDSFPLSGNGAATVSHTFAGLASNKTWTLSALSRDQNGIAIHEGSAAFLVRPRQIASVNLSLSARYSMLKANFHPIRDSVTRVELWVDGERKDDSSFAKQSALGDTVPLAFDYLTAGATHAIRMDVFGDMWGADTLLYTADTTLAIAAGEDASHHILLKWVGPTSAPPGQASMTVSLGAVGKVIVNGRLQDTASQYPVINLDSGLVEGQGPQPAGVHSACGLDAVAGFRGGGPGLSASSL